MREWVVQDYAAGYKSLCLRECDMPEPGPGEVRLKVEAFALNWGDMDLMEDRYTFSFDQLPARVGMEAAGIVDKLGPGVEGVELGARYCTLPYYYYNKGASADYITIATAYLTKAPEGLSAVESASIWMQYMTAYFPLVAASAIGAGTNLLVSAATSTAGSAAVEIGRICGAHVVGTSRYEHNRQYLQGLGASAVCVSGQPDFAQQLRHASRGRGFDVVFDAVGGSVMRDYAQVLARDARIYFYGFLEGDFPEVPFIEMLGANASFHPYSLFNYVENRALCEQGKAFVYDHIQRGTLRPSIDKVFPMTGYIDAWDYLKSSRTTHGKVLIKNEL